MAGKKPISLRKRVTGAVLIACIPVFVLLFVINAYSIELIQQRIYENTYDAMSLNMAQLDNDLSRASEYIVSEGQEGRYAADFSSEDSRTSYLGAIHYMEEIRERVLLYDMVEGILVYSPVNGRKIYTFNSHSSDFSEREQMLEYIVRNREELLLKSGIWNVCSPGEKKFLVCAAGNDEIIIAAWTSFDTLMTPVQNWKMAENSTLCFVSEEGERYTEVAPELENLNYAGDISQYYYAGENNQYLMFGVHSDAGNFRLIDVVEREALLSVFYQIRWLCILILLLFAAVLLPWMLKNLSDGVFVPVRRLEAGIEQVEKGNLDTVIAGGHSSREMEHLIRSFNNMTGQIRELKIQAYEDEIRRQQMQMNFMQLQIKPHFYLNALNLINAMAQNDDVPMIKKMTENMSAYLRYLTNTKDGVTTVREEVEHIGNYLKIMEMRYGDMFHYEQSVDERAEEIQIPPLMIQLLVENSMKYAFNFYEEVHLSVCVSVEEGEMICTVTDNGKGYPEEILRHFREETAAPEGHIGLWNCKTWLAYMYPGRSSFELSNLEPHGAKTEIRITISTEEREQS